MKSVGKTIVGAFLAAILATAASGASAITWELSGKLTVAYKSDETPPEILNLEGTPFSAHLTYNEAAVPGYQNRDMASYYDPANLVFTTILGSVNAELNNLSIFIIKAESGPAHLSRIRGAAIPNLMLDGPLSSLGIIPAILTFELVDNPGGLARV